MANPGYPQQQMGQMPHGMGQQMAPGPYGPPQNAMGMMMGRPMRRGTSRAVPVVVSAGLAVGVFCGLLFGLGTGKEAAAEQPAKGNNVKQGDSSSDTAPTGVGGTAATPVGGGATAPTGPVKNPNAITAGAGGTAPIAATGSGAAATKTFKLTIVVEPEAAAKEAKIVVDGTAITGTTIDVPADKKQVKVAITATGFHSFDKKVDIQDGDMKVTFEMVKRASGGTGVGSPGFGGASTGGNHVPTAPPKLPPKKPNNGIIDI